LDSPSERHWAVDVEADDFYATKVWCCCVENIKTREKKTLLTYEEIKEFFEQEIEKGSYFIGHNFIGYDGPTLNRVVGTRIPVSRMVDTFVLSMLYYPSLDGGHSVEAWGKRVGMKKGEFNDFSKLSDEMITYCVQDTAICAETFRRLVPRMIEVGFSEFGCEIEHRAWAIYHKQKKNGFYFDIDGARKLYKTLEEEKELLLREIQKHWPPELKEIKTYKASRKQNGDYTAAFEKHSSLYPKILVHGDGSYTTFDYVAFDPASPVERVKKLLSLGWVPEEFTKPSKSHPEGQPQPTQKGELSPSLVKFVEEKGLEEVKTLAQWIAVAGRASMINTWIEAFNENTHCIHGTLWLANSLRYRHSDPNTANAPKIRKDKEGKILFGREGYWTFESRALWQTRDPKTRRLLGVDAKGIQLRVLAQYLNNPVFTQAVLEGDPHSYNQQIGEFSSRDVAKTFIYAFLLGVGDAKAGKITGGSTADGKKVKSKFINNFPGLKELLDKLKEEFKETGRISLCDGSKVSLNSDHKVLGYLLQGDESRIMKLAKRMVDDRARKAGFDFLWVGDIHDEWQIDIREDHVQPFIEICTETFKEVGRIFNYTVPIECSAAVGFNWGETH
jgi:DNA polymerase-1